MEKEERIKKLNELNNMIKVILSTAFERNDYFFSDIDKKVIENFRQQLFDISIEEIENIPEFQEVLKIINKINKFSIKGRVEETAFVDGLFPENYIVDKLENHIEKIYLSKEKLTEEEIENLDKILTILVDSTIDITPNIEKSIKLLEINNVDITNMNFMTIFMQRFTESFLVKTEHDEKRFGLAYKYVDLSTKKENFDLFNNQGISDILQIIKRLPEEKSKKIMEIFYQNLNLDKVDIDEINCRTQSFLNKYCNSIVTDQKEFDDFLKDIQVSKIVQNDAIKPEIIKLVLKQFFSEGSVIDQNRDKYKGLLQRTIEDISANDLNQFGIQGSCFLRREYAQKMSAGQSIQPLFINVIDMKLFEEFLNNKNFYIIENIYHENTHLDQYVDLFLKPNSKKSDLRILELKEEIIKKYNPEYYVANYDLMFQEIEARERGYIKVLELINNLNLTGIDDLKENLQNRIVKEQSNYNIGRYKRKGINSNEKINVEKYYEELVKEHPEISREYPVTLEDNKKIGD